MRGFIAFIMGFIALWGISLLVILVPLAAFGVVHGVNSTVAEYFSRGELAGIIAGISILFLVWAGIMRALMGKKDRWKEIRWFRKLLLLLMSVPLLLFLVFDVLPMLLRLLLGIIIFFLLLGAGLHGLREASMTPLEKLAESIANIINKKE